MRVAIIEHDPLEEPGRIGLRLQRLGCRLTRVRRWRNERIEQAEDTDAVVLMGGPQSARDASDMIREELAWLRGWLRRGRATLGICLGAQLMARAAGAEILPSPLPEHGWYPLLPTAETRRDPVLGPLNWQGLYAFQWHGETFTLPRGASHLARSPAVPHQAFRLAPGQYGLQFHLEADAAMIEAWLAADRTVRERLGPEGIADLRRDTGRFLEAALAACDGLVGRWLERIRS